MKYIAKGFLKNLVAYDISERLCRPIMIADEPAKKNENFWVQDGT
jgi:hypothetical protein